MIARDVTDLPQPDSPTSPTVSPGRTSKLTPSTATNGFSPERWNVTRRSRTESRACAVSWAVWTFSMVSVMAYLRLLGSSASRSDSPISVKPRATMMMQTAG